MNVNIKFRDYSYALIEAENSTLMELRNYFSFEVEGARFNPKFRYGAWDGRIRLLSNEGTLPIGLVDTLVRYCQNNDLTVTIDEDFKKSNEISREDFDKWLDNLEIYSGDQRIKPHWYQADSVFTAINSQRRTLNLPTSAGKAQPLDCKILTPTGWSTMGQMEVGSVITTPDGTPANVIAIHPQGMKDIYEITFKDGRKTRCCEDHLWRIFSHDFSETDGKWRTMSLKQIMSLPGKRSRYIQTPAIEMPSAYHHIDPYVIGVLIGDGSLSQCQKSFVSIDREIIDQVSAKLPTGVVVRESATASRAIHCSIRSGTDGIKPIQMFKRELERLDLNCKSYAKRIPDDYKAGTIDQRKDLLRGLLDTDGTVGKNGDLSFSSVSKALAEDVVDVVRSIGGVASITSRNTPSDFGICYTVSINHADRKSLLSCDRKRSRLPETGRFNGRVQMTKITKVESQEAQCITIDSVDHLYVTDDYVVTHNSLIQCILSRWYMENYSGKILLLVPTTALVQQMRDDFVDYRLIPSAAIEMIGGGNKSRNSDALVVVSTWQSAIKQPSSWFRQFGMLICDECHLATGPSINKIVTVMGECRFKFGLSGSLKDGNTNIMQYIGMFGDIFRPVSTKTLMDEGQVTELEINSVFLRYPDDETILYKGIAYPEEIKVITKHTKRNAWVCKLALKLARDKNENVLVMFKNVKHGKMLYEALVAKYGDKVHYVSGETKTDDRVKLKGDAENEDGIIIVASYGVFSTGISIKKLHHIIFAHPVKSKVIVLQSLGRVLRKHQSKLKAKLWDIIDDFCVKPKSANAKKRYTHQNYAFKHGLERIARYNAEQFTYKTAEVIL